MDARCALHTSSPEAGRAPFAAHQLLLIMGPPAGGVSPACLAKAGGVCVVVRLSPPVLRSGLRWVRGCDNDPVGCG